MYDTSKQRTYTLADSIRDSAKDPDTGKYLGLAERASGSVKSKIEEAVYRVKKSAVDNQPQEQYNPMESMARYVNSISDEDSKRVVETPSPVEGEGPTRGGVRTGNRQYSGYESLMDLVDKTEGAGSYDTLFGHSQKNDFVGTKVSQMTIGELKKFSNGAYGDWSKQQLGYKATPMGRYQIVGQTLEATAKALGLPDDTVFSPAVQDKMFLYLANNASKKGLTGLRNEWEGFKNVPDDVLQTALDSFVSGNSLVPKPNSLVQRKGR